MRRAAGGATTTVVLAGRVAVLIAADTGPAPPGRRAVGPLRSTARRMREDAGRVVRAPGA